MEVHEGLGAMERQAIAESGDGDTVVIGAEKVADMEQQSGKASERGFDLNSVDVAEGYKPVSMLNKLQEMQAQEDLKAMETSEVDVDVEDIPEAQNSLRKTMKTKARNRRGRVCYVAIFRPSFHFSHMKREETM